MIDEFILIRKGVSKLEQNLNDFRMILDYEKTDEYLKDIETFKKWLYEVEEFIYNSNN